MKKAVAWVLHLDRKWKIVLNLLLAGILAVFMWGVFQFPISDPELSFRRAERANWVGPAEIRGMIETMYSRWVVGTYEDQVLLHRDDAEEFQYWPRRGDGITLFPVPEKKMMPEELWIMAVDVPYGAASARLELTVSRYYVRNQDSSWRVSATEETPGGWREGAPKQWEKTYKAMGESLGSGAFTFHIALEEQNKDEEELLAVSRACEWTTYLSGKGDRTVNCSMEAIFYDGSGMELGRGTLCSPDKV